MSAARSPYLPKGQISEDPNTFVCECITFVEKAARQLELAGLLLPPFSPRTKV